MTPSPPIAALGVGGRLFFGSLCAGTGALGVWQTQRYFEKKEQIAQRMTDLQRPPISYHDYWCTHQQQQQQNSSSPEPPSLRRLSVTGRFQHEAEMYVGPRGPPPGAVRAAGVPTSGYYIITPLILPPPVVPNDKGETPKQHQPHSILVNRGWIPRNMLPHNPKKDTSVDKDDAIRGPGHHQDYPYRHDKHFYHHDNDGGSGESAPWTRPNGTVQLTVVPTPPENPRYLIAQHNLETRPAVFFWYDVPSMISVTQTDGIPVAPIAPTATDTGSPPRTDLILVTQVDAAVATSISNSNDDSSPTAVVWPLVPTSAKMSDGRMNPIMHAGYAVTWFGLCLAGLYMTRRLAKGVRPPPPPGTVV